MSYYKFHPKNHICSLAWTGLILVSQIDIGESPFKALVTTSIMGVPTVFVGINIREKAEKKIRNRIIDHISLNKEVTVSQIANLFQISGQHARNTLNSLVTEERLEITNRSTDMAVIYILAN